MCKRKRKTVFRSPEGITEALVREWYDRWYVGESRGAEWIAAHNGVRRMAGVTPAAWFKRLGLRMRTPSEAGRAKHQIGRPWVWHDKPEAEPVAEPQPAMAVKPRAYKMSVAGYAATLDPIYEFVEQLKKAGIEVSVSIQVVANIGG